MRVTQPGERVYLGDGAYVMHDGHGAVVLTTDNGVRATNTIVLEVEPMNAFLSNFTVKKKADPDA